MQKFAVSDVSVRSTALPVVTLKSSLEARGIGRSEACASNLPNLVQERTARLHARGDGAIPLFGAIQPTANAFVNAVHTSFDLHLPLVLSPDDVWLCLAQGFGLHVQIHAEQLRARFVRHEDAKQLIVRRDGFARGSPENNWQGVFSEISDQIAKHIGKKRDLIVASFSTTNAIERAASEVVLLSAMQHYFEFMGFTLCGIPEITLLGTADDWRSIRRRVEVFAEFDLKEWVDALIPVLDQFVAASEGEVDRTFWRSLYKFEEDSGGPYVTGWMNAFFPYLEVMHANRRYTVPNPCATTWAELEKPEPLAELTDEDLERLFAESDDDASATEEEPGVVYYSISRPQVDNFPIGLSKAPFVWDYLGTEIAMEFLGGFVGIAQNPETLAVRPAIGWAIREAGPLG